jgi:hypothetical protein
MTSLPPLDSEELIRRIGRDLADSYDEDARSRDLLIMLSGGRGAAASTA